MGYDWEGLQREQDARGDGAGVALGVTWVVLGVVGVVLGLLGVFGSWENGVLWLALGTLTLLAYLVARRGRRAAPTDDPPGPTTPAP